MQKEVQEIQDIYADIRGLRHDLRGHTNGLKHHYLDLMQPYSYDTGDTQTLEIAYTSTGLHDLHQDYSLGNGDVDWIERKRTELEQELGREIYALF